MLRLEDLWLLSGKLPADLLNFLLDLGRGLLDNKIFLPSDGLLVLTQPLPQLLIFYTSLGLELAEIRNQGCENLGVDCIGLPFIEKSSGLCGIKTIVLEVIQPEEIFEHGCTEDR